MKSCSKALIGNGIPHDTSVVHIQSFINRIYDTRLNSLPLPVYTSWRSIIISSLVVVLRRELLRWHHSISHRIVSQQLKTKNFILFNLNQLMCLLTTLCRGFVRVTMTLVLRKFDITDRVCSKRKLNLYDDIL